MFLEEELHYHLSSALSRLHNLMDSENEEIVLESASRLSQLIIEIKNQQSSEQDIDLEEFFFEENEEDGKD